MKQTGRLSRATLFEKSQFASDFTRGDVALKYVKRGFALLSRHALTLLLIPLAASTAVIYSTALVNSSFLRGKSSLDAALNDRGTMQRI